MEGMNCFMRWYVITKRGLITAAVVIAVVIGTVTIAGKSVSTMVSNNANRKLPVYSVDTKEKKASLSFDAAWGNEDTPQLIEILSKYNVKATFFIVGQWADKYPESVKALKDAGHEIESHSDTHAKMPKLSREKMAEEIKNSADKIEKLTGTRPTLFRPPYGEYDNALIEVLTEQNHLGVQWSVDSHDWKDITSEKIIERVLKRAHPGAIMLFHNAAKNTPAALPAIIEKLQADGYTLVPIGQLVYRDNYTIDSKGMQSKKEAAAGGCVGCQCGHCKQPGSVCGENCDENCKCRHDV